MESLETNVHKPGDEFKGRVATFFGNDIDQPVNPQSPILTNRSTQILTTFNNEFQYASLMESGIPSLTEYNHSLSPRFYFLATRLFGRPGDQQIRNKVLMRNPDLNLLRLFGVNNIISDNEIPGLVPKASESSGFLKVSNYKLENVNLGNWSPTEVIVASNPFDTIRILKSSQFNPRESVVLDQAIEQKLVEAYDTNFTVEANQYRISALSTGFSLLLLPIEYSSCFEIEQQNRVDLAPRIYIANQLFFSILFERSLNISLKFRNGPLINADCRLNDYLSFKKVLN
jgi:hypothetical protein